jgi:CBS domain-containing protein
MRRRTLMDALTVGEAMRPVPQGVDERSAVRDVVARFSEADTQAVPVLYRAGQYRGTLLARQVERSLQEGAADVVVGDLAQQLPTLTATQTLRHALPSLVQNDGAGLPVLDADGRTVVGWPTHRDVLGLYHARAEARAAAARHAQ